MTKKGNVFVNFVMFGDIVGKTVNISRISHVALMHLHNLRGGEMFISMSMGNYLHNQGCV